MVTVDHPLRVVNLDETYSKRSTLVPWITGSQHPGVLGWNWWIPPWAWVQEIP